MTVSNRGVRVAVASFLLCTTAACVPGRAPADRLRPRARLFVPEIPVPEGFELLERVSEDWSDGLARYLRHRYAGRADKYRVRAFYRREMPLARWTLLSDANLHGRIAMHFQRAGESCTIYIDDSRAALSRRVVVDVLITPRREGATGRLESTNQ